VSAARVICRDQRIYPERVTARSSATNARAPRRRTQEERSAETRARLLDATIECLVDFGYAGTTTPRIAEKAGVTRGAQVHHFNSKNELVLAAVEHLSVKLTQSATSQVSRMKTDDDLLGSVLDLLWHIHTGPIFVATVELWVAGRTDHDLGVAASRIQGVITGALVEVVGRFVPDELSRSLTDFVYTAMDAIRGILLSSFTDTDPDRARRRWDRAASNLRRVAGDDLLIWVAGQH
jgi:AcrR family transcriptional regulator